MKKNRDGKKKWMVIIIAAIIVFSMVFSIFAVMVDNQSQTIPDYNKHSFISSNNLYKTKINGNYMEFYNYPAQLEQIPLSSEIKQKLKYSTGIAFVFNPNDNITGNLQYLDVIRYDLETQLDKPTYFGITQNSSKYLLPIVSCDNATADFPFIMITPSIETSFNISTENPNCIIMNAKLLGLLSAKDRLIYTYYDIMN